jgi:hypothetical protein
MFVFPSCAAHWGDVGGMSPGSLSGRATEIFQEGVRIPPIRIVERGRPNDAALDLIFSNMRGARERRGDFQAMLGTCRKAAGADRGIAARYGEATIRDAVAELMDRAEGACVARFVALRPANTCTRRIWKPGPSGWSRSRCAPGLGRRRHDHGGSGRHLAADARARPTWARRWRRPARSRSSSRSSIPAPT